MGIFHYFHTPMQVYYPVCFFVTRRASTVLVSGVVLTVNDGKWNRMFLVFSQKIHLLHLDVAWKLVMEAANA